jgi:archaellum component FlaF (FlaF/FlaG flagellin family)
VVAQAGHYHVDVSVQIASSNSSSKDVYIWIEKNGTNLADTTRAISISGNGTYLPFSANYDVSLEANQYVRVMWATSDTSVTLEAFAASAFAPAGPSAIVSVTQTQL